MKVPLRTFLRFASESPLPFIASAHKKAFLFLPEGRQKNHQKGIYFQSPQKHAEN